MASSPSHKLGELIGDFFEFAIVNYLKPKVTSKGYYLDYRHPRPARDNQREVRGVDKNGNEHKLDIVVEKGGSEENFGSPKAFIEMAWRRYKKHSKNKVQEIAGAIIPLIDTYAKEIPFYSAVLAGEFTDNAIKQLQSQGFYVLYFSYEEICRLFDKVKISIRWEEDTSEDELQKIVDQIESLGNDGNEYLQKQFFKMYARQLTELENQLNRALDNHIANILIIPIHGSTHLLNSVSDAVNFILTYDENENEPILQYEIIIRYSNGDEYTMKCSDKQRAIQFLNQYT